jgi:hypothetical protein
MADMYHANFRTREYRPSRPANSITFGAAGDGAAAAVAAELGNWTVGQLTSLTKKVGGDGPVTPYPVGTRITCTAHCLGSDDSVYRVRFRNVHPGVSEADIVALLTGVAGPGGSSFAVAALGGHPLIPGTTVEIVLVSSVTFSNKK